MTHRYRMKSPWHTTTRRPRPTLAVKLATYVCAACGSHLTLHSRRAVCPDGCAAGICAPEQYAEIVAARALRDARPLPELSPETRARHLAALFAEGE